MIDIGFGFLVVLTFNVLLGLTLLASYLWDCRKFRVKAQRFNRLMDENLKAKTQMPMALYEIRGAPEAKGRVR